MKAEKRTWRERRGTGWSETQYRGLYLHIGLQELLISKLSHGLRVIEVKTPGHYQFDQIPGRLVELSEAFVDEILYALAADQRFQARLGEYDRLLGTD